MNFSTGSLYRKPRRNLKSSNEFHPIKIINFNRPSGDLIPGPIWSKVKMTYLPTLVSNPLFLNKYTFIHFPLEIILFTLLNIIMI